jgi:translation initiation factor IF-1
VPREDAITVEATVLEALPNTLFRVQLANGHRVMAHLAGRLRMSFVRLQPGDRVTLEMSPFYLSKGCITLKNENVKQ